MTYNANFFFFRPKDDHYRLYDMLTLKAKTTPRSLVEDPTARVVSTRKRVSMICRTRDLCRGENRKCSRPYTVGHAAVSQVGRGACLALTSLRYFIPILLTKDFGTWESAISITCTCNKNDSMQGFKSISLRPTGQSVLPKGLYKFPHTDIQFSCLTLCPLNSDIYASSDRKCCVRLLFQALQSHAHSWISDWEIGTLLKCLTSTQHMTKIPTM